MSYQVLARKLRPATFDAMVGQEHVVRALRHALDHGRLHHAYLFTGTRGVGKTTIARVLAKCLNCERGVSSQPCGECSICREVAENRFIDLIEVDAASRTRVDDTRDLLENAQYLPTRGRYKVYLIDEVHMLSGASFNALLKTLEEPPSHVVFLLATTDPKKVPVTVLSRCLQFQLKNLSAERIAQYLGGVLGDEGIPFEAQALELIATAARGSMRDALSITDQAIAFGQGTVRAADVGDMLGLVGRDAVAGLLDALAARDAGRLLTMSAELAERSVDFDDVLAELIEAFHSLAVEQALRPPGVAGGSPGSATFAPEVVQLYYQIALLGYRDLAIAPDPRCGFEMTLLRMLAFAPDDAGARVAPILADGSVPAAPWPAGSTAGSVDTASATDASSATALRASRVPEAGLAVPNEARATAGAADAVCPPGLQGPATEASARPGRTSVAAGPAAAGRVGAEAVAGPVALAAGSENWFATVTSLGLSGVARMIAEHSELLESRGNVYRLRLDSAHDTLLADAPVAALERALGAKLGGPIRLVVEVGAVATETPAARLARERIERQRAAEETLATDDTVQQLLSEFDGRIEGVTPIE
jgi:DNA polymerase-3 subunit gamma/tau